MNAPKIIEGFRKVVNGLPSDFYGEVSVQIRFGSADLVRVNQTIKIEDGANRGNGKSGI